MEDKKRPDKKEERHLKIFCIISILMLFVGAFLLNTPADIMKGLYKIFISRDALITDYFQLANYGAAFFNAGLVSLAVFLLLIILQVPFTGITFAALFINAGYALWGKNIINILPIIIGTFLYAIVHRTSFRRYIYIAVFGTCLAPIVTEMTYILPFSDGINLLLAILTGILVGFLLPPLSTHTATMHMGYNLYNVGFSGGILAFVLVCILSSFGLESTPVFIWKEGYHIGIVIWLYVYFVLIFAYGLYICKGKISVIKKIMKHSGRAVADFILMDGAGATFMNMGIVGVLCTTYIVVIKGDFSGPVIGGIFTAVGFAAFGVHIRNYIPVLIGVYLFTWLGQFDPTTPGIQLAAIFAIGLAPIAGQFGIVPGIIAGMLHAAIVMCTSQLYGGLNLYNNGFSAGWVAIVMVPVLESSMKYYKMRKKQRVWRHNKSAQKED